MLSPTLCATLRSNLRLKFCRRRIGHGGGTGVMRTRSGSLNHFRSGEELETTLQRYVWLFNQ